MVYDVGHKNERYKAPLMFEKMWRGIRPNGLARGEHQMC